MSGVRTSLRRSERVNKTINTSRSPSPHASGITRRDTTTSTTTPRTAKNSRLATWGIYAVYKQRQQQQHEQQQQQIQQQQDDDWADQASDHSMVSSLSIASVASAAAVPRQQPSFLARLEEMETRITTNERRMHNAEEQLKQMDALIAENQQLRSQLEEANAHIANLEDAMQRATTAEAPTVTPADHPVVGMEVDPTGARESCWALTDAEYERRKQERAVVTKRLEEQRARRLEQQFKKIERQQQQQQQPAQQQQQQQQKSTAKTAKSLYAKVAAKHVAPKQKKVVPPSPKQIERAQRLFQPACDKTGYVVVYLPTPRRVTHREVRHSLRLLQIDQERVIDVHFPAHEVVGLLIHASYESELREKLKQQKTTPKDAFNPTAASTIGNPTVIAEKTETERAALAKELYQKRMLALCVRMPKKHLAVAIMRHFTSLPEDDHHHVDVAYWTQFQQQCPKPASRRRRQSISSVDEARNLLSPKSVNNNDEADTMDQD